MVIARLERLERREARKDPVHAAVAKVQHKQSHMSRHDPRPQSVRQGSTTTVQDYLVDIRQRLLKQRHLCRHRAWAYFFLFANKYMRLHSRLMELFPAPPDYSFEISAAESRAIADWSGKAGREILDCICDGGDVDKVAQRLASTMPF
jgi:hypothetical protein